jgi:hypothetical protein
MAEIKVKHDYIDIITEGPNGRSSYLIEVQDYDGALVLNISARGKNALRMKIRPKLESEIFLELEK